MTDPHQIHKTLKNYNFDSILKIKIVICKLFPFARSYPYINVFSCLLTKLLILIFM